MDDDTKAAIVNLENSLLEEKASRLKMNCSILEGVTSLTNSIAVEIQSRTADDKLLLDFISDLQDIAKTHRDFLVFMGRALFLCLLVIVFQFAYLFYLITK